MCEFVAGEGRKKTKSRLFFYDRNLHRNLTSACKMSLKKLGRGRGRRRDFYEEEDVTMGGVFTEDATEDATEDNDDDDDDDEAGRRLPCGG